jgi:hypothetical protein
MRYTLIAGLLVVLPTAALLASAAVASLITKMRQSVKRRFHDPGRTRTEPDRPLAVMRDREGMRDNASFSSVSAGRLDVVQSAAVCPLPLKNVSTRR